MSVWLKRLVCVLITVSNEVPEHPCVSPVSSQVFERRLIEKYIAENGTDPMNGQPLSEEQLVDIKGKITESDGKFRLLDWTFLLLSMHFIHNASVLLWRMYSKGYVLCCQKHSLLLHIQSPPQTHIFRQTYSWLLLETFVLDCFIMLLLISVFFFNCCMATLNVLKAPYKWIILSIISSHDAICRITISECVSYWNELYLQYKSRLCIFGWVAL